MDRPTRLFELEIETDGRLISVKDFSYFLYLFRAAYIVAFELQWQQPVFNPSPVDYEHLVQATRERMSSLGRGLLPVARKDLDPAIDLAIEHISRRNPLDITISGMEVALTVAVIISGGTIQLGSFKVKLPPLGKGIAELKKALGVTNDTKPRKKG